MQMEPRIGNDLSYSSYCTCSKCFSNYYATETPVNLPAPVDIAIFHLPSLHNFYSESGRKFPEFHNEPNYSLSNLPTIFNDNIITGPLDYPFNFVAAGLMSRHNYNNLLQNNSTNNINLTNNNNCFNNQNNYRNNHKYDNDDYDDVNNSADIIIPSTDRTNTITALQRDIDDSNNNNYHSNSKSPTFKSKYYYRARNIDELRLGWVDVEYDESSNFKDIDSYTQESDSGDVETIELNPEWVESIRQRRNVKEQKKKEERIKVYNERPIRHQNKINTVKNNNNETEKYNRYNLYKDKYNLICMGDAMLNSRYDEYISINNPPYWPFLPMNKKE